MEQPEDLPLSKQIAYAIGQFGWSTLVNLVGLQLLYFYAPPDSAGFPYFITQATFLVVLNTISLMLAGGRLWDAVTDPIIASWSDRSNHPRGRRIPFLAWGALPSALFCTLMFVPPVGAVSGWNIVWLGAMQLLFFLFITIYVTPFFALLPELGHTENQRLNLSTYISITWALGLVLAATTPALGTIMGERFGLDRVRSLQAGVAVISFVGMLLMFVPVIFIDERRYCSSEPSTVPLLPALRQALANRNFRMYVVADMAYFCAITVVTTGLLYYTTVLLFPDNPREGETMVTPMGTIMVLVSFLLYIPANLLAKKMGKKKLIVIAFVVFGLVFVYVFFLGRLPISPYLQAYLLGAMAALPLASLGVLPMACLADIAEHDGRKTGIRQEGLFFAARTLLQKIGVTAGILIFAGLTTFGKDPGNDLGIRLSGPVGLVLCLVAAGFFARYQEKELLDELKSLGGR